MPRSPPGAQGPPGPKGDTAATGRTVAATPAPTRALPTPAPTRVPSTPTPAPTPTPIPDLANTTRANLWIYPSDGESGWLEVYADPAFDVDAFDLDVFVEGSEYCNPNRIYGDEGAFELSCEILEILHMSVNRVSAQASGIGDLRCERNFQSDATETIFACAWR